jgi:cytosine permease
VASVTEAELIGAEIGRDDYSLSRIPESERYSWWTVAIQRFGMLSALSQFLLGATLGFGMEFWDAVLAVTLGAAILEVVSIFTGIAGQREGLSTTLLARWTGFGYYGSLFLSLVIVMSLVGWFGVQNEVFAQGLKSIVGGPPVWLWAIVTGAVVTVIVIYGFLSMAWTAYVTVPIFLGLVTWSIVSALDDHAFGDLVSMAAPGPELGLGAAATFVAGGFIVGACITPDQTRFNRSAGDVVKQTVVSITGGEYLVCLAGVLLAHAAGTSDVIAIITSTVGSVGVLVLVTATLKINDWNLYSGSLGMVNLFHLGTGKHLPRGFVTVIVGAIGTALSAAGILAHLTDFLILLGVFVPPVAGIMTAEYYVVRRHRMELDRSRAEGTLPRYVERFNVPMVVAWAAGFAVGEWVDWGIPALNALLLSAALYTVLSQFGSPRHEEIPLESRAGRTEPLVAGRA